MIVVTAALSVTLTWIFTEITHRNTSKRNSTTEIGLLHKSEQIKILNELPDEVLAYYNAYSNYLWLAWAEKHSSLSKKDMSQLEKSWKSMEDSALRLFALSAKIDDVSIRAEVDLLEEIARWNTVEPGAHTENGKFSKSRANILKDDQSIQRRAILLNLTIGDRQLKLLGSHNPERPLRTAA